LGLVRGKFESWGVLGLALSTAVGKNLLVRGLAAAVKNLLVLGLGLGLALGLALGLLLGASESVLGLSLGVVDGTNG
jgi:hypothetical protein